MDNTRTVTTREANLLDAVRDLRRALMVRARLGSGGDFADCMTATREIEVARARVRGCLEDLDAGL